MKKNIGFSLGVWVLVFCAAFLPGVTIAADKYPSREIQLVVPNAPGGYVDTAVQAITESLGKQLGVSIVVSNRAGAGGATGTHYLVKAKPDGYTIASLSLREIVVLPATVPDVPYKMTDLDPLCKYTLEHIIIYCKADSPWKTLDDLVADAKKRPGQIIYGATTQSISQLIMEGFLKEAGIKVLHVPLPSAGEALTRVIGGNLNVGLGGLAAAEGQLKVGVLRGLAIATLGRVSEFPQIPTLKEKGYDPVIGQYSGFFAPIGLPKPVRDTLVNALEKTIKDPALKERLGHHFIIPNYLPTEAYTKELAEDYKRVIAIIKGMEPPK